MLCLECLIYDLEFQPGLACMRKRIDCFLDPARTLCFQAPGEAPPFRSTTPSPHGAKRTLLTLTRESLASGLCSPRAIMSRVTSSAA